jgi:hypothetical protein
VPDTHDNRQRFGISDFASLPSPLEGDINNYQDACQSLLDRMIQKITLKGYSFFYAEELV